jgi:hypothetical protein
MLDRRILLPDHIAARYEQAPTQPFQRCALPAWRRVDQLACAN